jgi:RimJ/RimL family protein N-acetyltransferase
MRSRRRCENIVRHDFHLRGRAFQLRPVTENDAEFILHLRSRAGRFLSPGASSKAEQLEWLADYFTRAGDFYFVVESMFGSRREGVLGLYDIDEGERTAEWGRWVLESASSAAVESALLIYRCAFEKLNLERVRCRTLVENRRVISFHESCGLVREESFATVGESLPTVMHTLSRAEWPAIRARLDRLATRFAARHAAPVGSVNR